jgi:hypothetical protein
MKRLANSYVSLAQGEATGAREVSLTNEEFAQFMAGQRSEMSPETTEYIRKALHKGDAKLKLFLAAYTQKSITRVAKLMLALDHVEPELLAPWRVKSMSSKELIDLFSELNDEKSRMVKEVASINNLNINGEQEFDSATMAKRIALSPESKGKVLKFFHERIAISQEG